MEWYLLGESLMKVWKKPLVNELCIEFTLTYHSGPGPGVGNADSNGNGTNKANGVSNGPSGNGHGFGL